MNKIYLSSSFKLKSITKEHRNDEEFAVFSGYASDFNVVDHGNDRVAAGAFADSIKEHIERDNRPIRMFSQHNSYDVPIGAFPIELVREDSRGLFCTGEINLGIQRGHETYLAVQQNTMSDMSIGGRIVDSGVEDGVNIIKQFQLFEISIVSEPMNSGAQITSKSVTAFLDLPLASRDTEFTDDAEERVRAFTGSIDAPSSSYSDAFLFVDDDNNTDNFSSYQLQIADVIDDELVAIPEAIFFAAGQLESGIGTDDISSSDRAEIVAHIVRYYDKMGMDDPFEPDDFSESGIRPIIQKIKTVKDLDKFMKKFFFGTKSERELLVHQIKKVLRVDPVNKPSPPRVEPDAAFTSISKLLSDISNNINASI